MALTVASYSELSTRFPVSAGEAAYVMAAFRSRRFSTTVGLLTVAIGVISSAAVTLGSAGYIQQFVGLPKSVIVIAVLALLGGVACWGILEFCCPGQYLYADRGRRTCYRCHCRRLCRPPHCRNDRTHAAAECNRAIGNSLWQFARIFCFHRLRGPRERCRGSQGSHRDIPRAMVLTLLISTILYVVVAAIAVTAVPIERLSSSSAPLSLVFREVAAISPATITAIAIVATLNTILAQMTMAARVIYGVARERQLPAVLAHVSPRTGTPLVATVLIVAMVIPLALFLPLASLAEATSLATLVVFALVNLSLLRLRYRGVQSKTPHVTIPALVPAPGFATCIAMMAIAF